MNTQSLEIQILSFLQDVRNASGLSADHPQYEQAKEAEAIFIGGVEFLRSTFPNPCIQRLAGVLWEAVGQKITPVCWGLNVKSLSFILAGLRTAPQAMVAVPSNWVKMIGQDPITQLGDLVFVGSQVVDYVHDHFLTDQANVKPRALAYEAEYLKAVKNLSPSWQPVSYQLEVLEDFPEGLASPKAQKIVYPIKPLVMA